MAARKSMPREGVEMKERFETFVVQGTNESFTTSDNHMLFMSPIVNPPIVNSMDTGLSSANWSSVDYSVLRGNAGTATIPVPVQLMDTTASLNYIQHSQQPTMQAIPNTHEPHLITHSSSTQGHSAHQQQQQQSQQQPVQHQQTHASVVEVSNTHGQQAVGQLLQTVVQSSAAQNHTINLHPQLLVTNQHVPSNMWQSNAPPQAPLQPQPSLIVGHVQQHHAQPDSNQHTVLPPQQPQQQTTYVNVGVQAGGIDADGNPTLDPMPDTEQQRSHSKLPAKKRLSNMVQSSGNSGLFSGNAPPKKRSKISSDRKGGKATNVQDGKEVAKKKRTAIRKKKRNSNPNNWKKNVRKLSRVQGQPYINSRGKLVPAKTRTGPPCNCRMKCYERILEEECNEIFQRFLQIADKDIQDALLYSLITKEEVKHRKGQRVYRDSTEQQDAVESGESPEGRHNVRNATFLYHVQCQEGIVRVCSSAFSSIYGATQKRIRRLQQHKFIDPLNPPIDLRGKHGQQKDVRGRKPEASPGKILGKMGMTPKSKEEMEQKRLRANLVTEGIAFCVNKLTQPRTTNHNHHQIMVNTNSNKPVDYSVISNQQGLLTAEEHQQAEQQAIADSGAMEASNFLGGFLLGASGAADMKLLPNYDNAETAVKNITGMSLQDTVQQAVGDLNDRIEKASKESKDNSKPSGRSRHPELWKKNIRKKNRAHGMAYINTKGKLVPAKSRSGPPCHCRMRCYLRINEEQCNKIFSDFHNIGDKNVQDGLLYNLMIHKEVKKRKVRPGILGSIELQEEDGIEQSEGTEPKVKPVYQGDLLDFFLNDKDSVQTSEMQDKFMQNLVSGGMADLSDSSSQREEDGGFTGIINLSTRNIATSGVSTNAGITFSGSTSQQQHSGLCSEMSEREGEVFSLNHHKKLASQKGRDRQSTFWYYVQLSSGLVRVCSTAFMSIYGATQKRVRRLQQHKVVNPITPPKDMRGKHGHSGTLQQVKEKPTGASKSKRSKNNSNTTRSTGNSSKTGSNSVGKDGESNNNKDVSDTVVSELHHPHHLHHQHPQHQHAEVLHNSIIMVTPESVVRSSQNMPSSTQVPHTTPQPGIFLPSQGAGSIQAMNLAEQSQIWQNSVHVAQPQQHHNQTDIHL